MRSEGYCSWVCVSVCLLSHISPMERLFVLKPLSRTQRATKVKNFVGFSEKTAPLQRSSTPSVVRPCVQSAIFLRKARMRIIVFTTWWTGSGHCVIINPGCAATSAQKLKWPFYYNDSIHYRGPSWVTQPIN